MNVSPSLVTQVEALIKWCDDSPSAFITMSQMKEKLQPLLALLVEQQQKTEQEKPHEHEDIVLNAVIDAAIKDRQRLATLQTDLADSQRTIKSIATMLGWDNVPPQRTLEMDISTLKARVVDSQAEVQRLTDALQAENDIIAALTEQLNLLRDDK